MFEFWGTSPLNKKMGLGVNLHAQPEMKVYP